MRLFPVTDELTRGLQRYQKRIEGYTLRPNGERVYYISCESKNCSELIPLRRLRTRGQETCHTCQANGLVWRGYPVLNKKVQPYFSSIGDRTVKNGAVTWYIRCITKNCKGLIHHQWVAKNDQQCDQCRKIKWTIFGRQVISAKLKLAYEKHKEKISGFYEDKGGNRVIVFRCANLSCENDTRSRKIVDIGRKRCRYCNAPGRLPENVAVFTRLKEGARKRNISFSLSFRSFCVLMKNNECFYCGAQIARNYNRSPASKKTVSGHGLDRVDNGKGYTYDNVIQCCKKCNMDKKSSLSCREMLLIASFRRFDQERMQAIVIAKVKEVKEALKRFRRGGIGFAWTAST